MKRTLRLRRESLAELAPAELAAVEAGAASAPLSACVTELPTFGHASCRQCITHTGCTS